MNLTKRFIDIAWALVHPKFWISNRPSCPDVDRVINKMIDHDVFVAVGRHTAITSDKHEVWVSNYPYAFGDIRTGGYGSTCLLPYRRTRARLKKHLDAKFGVYNEIEEKLDLYTKVKKEWSK